MADSQSTHYSYWLGSRRLESRFPKLQGREKTQVAVLGGGITGLSTALELLEHGWEVSVIEALTIGAGTTGGSTGHLDAHPEQDALPLVKKFGLENGQKVIAERLRAIDTLEQRCTPECDFQRLPGYRYSESPLVTENKAGNPPPTISTPEELKADMQAAADLGLSVEWCASVPIARGGFGYRIDNMGRMDSFAYVQHLADLVVQHGGRIFENSCASGPVEKEPTELKIGDAVIEFEHVVCAVHCNYSDVLRTYFQTPPYQSYVLAARVKNPPADALFWDSSDPYYYTRLAVSNDPEVIIVGGCDKRTGAHKSDEVAQALVDYVRARYDVREIIKQWSAELFEPVDDMPIIGLLPGKKNVWVATGMSGVGLTWGTAAGRILAEQISGRETPLDSLLTPSRFSLNSISKLISEQATSVVDMMQRIVPVHRFDAETLTRGQGTVGVDNHQHVAACRDSSGCLHKHNPICPHMGGVVQWNEAEQTWDCPVHGGRFAADGTRIYGPPEAALAKPGETSSE